MILFYLSISCLVFLALFFYKGLFVLNKSNTAKELNCDKINKDSLGIYVINLEKDTKRYENISNLAGQMGEFTKINAIYGKDFI